MYTDFGFGDDNVIVYFIADIWITMNFNLIYYQLNIWKLKEKSWGTFQ